MTARIAILADTSLQRHILQRALAGSGYQVVFNQDPTGLAPAELHGCAADLWLVDLAQGEDLPLLDDLLEGDTPVLFGEGKAPERSSEHYPRWERSLFGKLKRLVGDPAAAVGPSLQGLLNENETVEPLSLPASLAQAPAEPAREVWLLAASLGGPVAVKAFLDALPAGLPVAFLYAQHIDAAFEASLPQAVGRHSQWTVRPLQPGAPLCNGEVQVVPIANELAFAADGSLTLLERGWPEPYSPSIDQMMLSLAGQFGARCGVIAFSGMGSDGSAAAAYVRRQGAPIWTQSADSCVCSSMPDSLREGGYSELSGNPRELAAALVKHLAERPRDA